MLNYIRNTFNIRFLSTWESRELHAESLTGAEPATGIEPSADAEAAPSEEPQVAEA